MPRGVFDCTARRANTNNEEPRPREATDQVEQVQQQQDERAEEGGHSHKLHIVLRAVPVPHADTDERQKAQHLCDQVAKQTK